MKLADIVRLQTHFGVPAPAFTWWAAALALVSVALVLLWLFSALQFLAAASSVPPDDCSTSERRTLPDKA